MRSLGSNRGASNGDDDNPYWMSFSDVMAGLLVLFVLASLVLVLELTETKQQVDEAILELSEAENVRAQILRDIKEELRQQGVDVVVSDNETVLRIPEDTLSFEPDRFRIPPDPEVKRKLKLVAKVVHDMIVKDRRYEYLDTIFLEGHTDIRRSFRQYGNWSLSAMRAISVWVYWNEEFDSGERLMELRNHDASPLFSVSGYGETRPITEVQRSEAEFRLNRRLDLRITVKKPQLQDLELIQEKL